MALINQILAAAEVVHYSTAASCVDQGVALAASGAMSAGREHGAYPTSGQRCQTAVRIGAAFQWQDRSADGVSRDHLASY